MIGRVNCLFCNIHQERQDDERPFHSEYGLVVNAIIVWNTHDLERALGGLCAARHVVRDEDVARLAPLVQEHVNVLGCYNFSLPDTLQRGE